jgi:4-hydroxy-tetrahydrodipicolinate synthase
MHDLCQKWFDGDIQGCRRLHEKYLKLMKMMFCEVNPIPVKTALSMMGLCVDELRLPMCQAEEGTKDRLNDVLLEYDISK